MATKTKRRRQKGRQKQVPEQRAAPPERQWWLYAGGAAGLAAVAAVLALTVFHGGKSGREESAGLPETPDYHSLLVNPSNSQKLVLGTHVGLYASSDGGRHWRFDALSGEPEGRPGRARQERRPAGRAAKSRHPWVRRRSAQRQDPLRGRRGP